MLDFVEDVLEADHGSGEYNGADAERVPATRLRFARPHDAGWPPKSAALSECRHESCCLAQPYAAGRRVAGPGAPGNTKGGFFVSKRLSKSILFFVVLLVAVAAIPAFAGPVPSKTAVNQSLESRDADLQVVRDVASNEDIKAVLTANGFTQEEVDQKLAQMSSQDLHQLRSNLEQLQPAGLTRQEWIWIGIGALAALILVIALGD
ncbi:MAG TPA: PA2779 family protein [Thermoanaerobaculia bacterium]|nr:PA2779 family protein [Thermoanaerobaculia bacterium]